MENKKKWILCAGCIVVVILAVIFLIPKPGSNSEYDKAARSAAEKLLEDEIKDCSSWTTVKTGKLEYFYTFYNEEIDKYLVYYCTRFDEADEDEKQWIVIEVYLEGPSLTVESATPVYYDEYSYKSLKADKQKKISIQDQYGVWKMID